MNTKLLYVSGQGHTGSTLLTLLLGAHTQVTSVGEANAFSESRRRSKLEKFQRRHASLPPDERPVYQPFMDQPCMCRSESVRGCSFWMEVERRLEAEHGMDLDALDLESDDDQEFADHNRALFTAVGEVSGSKYIVDASKSATRLEKLQSVSGLEVYPIRLHRSALGTTYSSVKRGSPWYRAAISYFRNEGRLDDCFSRFEHSLVSYEELASNPRSVMEALMRDVGLSFESAQLELAGTTQHLIAGNRMRFQRSDGIRLDQNWRDELSWHQQSIISWVEGSRTIRRILESL
jgi:hypothetical protein